MKMTWDYNGKGWDKNDMRIRARMKETGMRMKKPWIENEKARLIMR